MQTLECSPECYVIHFIVLPWRKGASYRMIYNTEIFHFISKRVKRHEMICHSSAKWYFGKNVEEITLNSLEIKPFEQKLFKSRNDISSGPQVNPLSLWYMESLDYNPIFKQLYHTQYTLKVMFIKMAIWIVSRLPSKLFHTALTF